MHKKKLARCLLLSAIAALSGCQNKVLDFRNVSIVNGKIYKRDANEPFSGKVTNIPDAKILSSQNGFASYITVLKSIFISNNSRYLDKVLFSSSLCNVKVRDGVLDGEVTCKQPQSEMMRYQMSFNNGALNGDFKLFDLSDKNNLVSKASFKNGLLDGKQEIHNLETHKIIYRTNWDKGIANGSEEAFDESTGNRTYSGKYVDGKLDGDITKYASDGKRVIYKVTVASNLKNSVEEQFDQNTGKRILSAQWSNGKRNGPFKQWDAAGNLIIDQVYENDVEVKPKRVQISSNIDACVDRWTNAYRHEQGNDAMVTANQIGEWQAWCKEGKNPR